MNVLKVIVMAPVFIILLIVILHTVRKALDFGEISSFLISVCVSILATIGMDYFLEDSIEAILYPYAVMAILILTVYLLSFIGKPAKETKRRLPDHTIRKNDDAQTYNKHLRR